MALYSGSLLLDLLGLLTAIVAVGYAYIFWSFQYWRRRNVPYLEPVFPWGNLQNPLTKTKSVGKEMTELYSQAKPKGWKYFGIHAFTQVNFMVIDRDIIKQVMTKDFHNFVDRGTYTNEKDDPLSAHLFAIGGTKWRNLRAKLSPTFTSGKMKTMLSTLVDCGLVLESFIEDNIDSKEGIEIKEVLGKFSTDIIGSCAFGLECNSFKDPNSPFRTHGKTFFDRSKFEDAKLIFANNFPNIARQLGMIVLPKGLSTFLRAVVEDTINYRQKNNYTRNDFLQLLIGIMNNKPDGENGVIGDGRTLTMDEAAAQCFVFFAAGFETSSTTMTFALFEMAQNQAIQDRVREEIKTVLAKHDNQMTYDSLSELKYMKQVIDETLRMYSAVPFVTRIAGRDYKIPGEDVVIEKGTKVVIPIQGIHMDPEYYENPSVFDPERFNVDNKATRPPYVHMAFGEGPRICIGERFGIMQTKVGLTSILRKFKVTLNRKTELPLRFNRNLIPSVDGGVWMNLEKL